MHAFLKSLLVLPHRGPLLEKSFQPFLSVLGLPALDAEFGGFPDGGIEISGVGGLVEHEPPEVHP